MKRPDVHPYAICSGLRRSLPCCWAGIALLRDSNIWNSKSSSQWRICEVINARLVVR